MRQFVKRTLTERATGKRPSAPRAIGTALAVGTAAAAITYRALRHESKGS
jgi:hypothetical protein